MSSISLCRQKQSGNILLVVLLLLWAITSYVLANTQRLQQQSLWLKALNQHSEYQAGARRALALYIEQLANDRVPRLMSSIDHQGYNVLAENLSVDIDDQPRYLLAVKNKAKGHTILLQAVHGHGSRALWLP